MFRTLRGLGTGLPVAETADVFPLPLGVATSLAAAAVAPSEVTKPVGGAEEGRGGTGWFLVELAAMVCARERGKGTGLAGLGSPDGNLSLSSPPPPPPPSLPSHGDMLRLRDRNTLSSSVVSGLASMVSS